ncbi:hypothetical protein D3C81_1924570 [compost metagenome]
MHARAFVLYPLAELATADLQLADGRLLRALLADCPFIGLERLAPETAHAVTPVTLQQ